MDEPQIRRYESATVEAVDPTEVDEVVGVLRHLIKSVSSASLKRYLRSVRADVTRLVQDAPIDETSGDSASQSNAAA